MTDREHHFQEDALRLQIENLDLRRLLEQAGIDAAEKKTLEQLQRLMLEELHHRIKNTLATVIAITSQSLRTATSIENGRQAVIDRLLALGRVHDILLQANWTSAPFTTIVKQAIEPFDEPGRFVLESFDIEVGAAAVLPLAMVLNELCTNAVKYGALSNAAGKVTITATVDTAAKLFRLRWVESGGPEVTIPTRRSFGTKLIEHSFARQLNGEAELTFARFGVVCVLDIPVATIAKADNDR